MYLCHATRVVVTDVIATGTLSVTAITEPNPGVWEHNPISLLPSSADVLRNCAFRGYFLFEQRRKIANLQLECICLHPTLHRYPDSSSKVALLIASQVISRALLCCSLSSTACRCGWDLTSIGFLMTVLFVRRVPPRKADVWQEIAVEEDWASCWAGLLSRRPVRSPSPLAFPPFSLTPSPNFPLWAWNGIV